MSRSFKRASKRTILDGVWTPFNLKYFPFADVDEFCNPCYRWRFLELIRGSFPRWGGLLVNPNDPNEEFPQYFLFESRFREFAVVLMRALARSTYPDSIMRNIRDPGQLLDSIRGNSDPEDSDIRTMNSISQYLERLNNENVLDRYHSSRDVLFNLNVLNEDFNIYRSDNTRVTLTQLRRANIGIGSQRPSNSFYWRGLIAIKGIIPMIHLKNREIRVPVPIADNFFDPPLDLRDNINTPEGIRLFFIIKEFHKMWILRESLAQLVENQKLPLELYDAMDNVIFSSHYDLNNINFREFDIIVDTIDHSIRMNPMQNFKNETGQAAIILNFLYSNYPGIVNSFQGFNPCPFQIGQNIPRDYLCPIGGTQGCGMKDRRISNQQFPRDRVESNIYKFLRYLRDEAVFKHETLFKITRLFPLQLFDLNQFSSFWIGEIYQDNTQQWIFHPSMPNHWTLPEVSDRKYDVCLMSPLCYESDCKISFERRLVNNDYIITPIVPMNPWIQNNPYNLASVGGGNNINCIIGKLSITEDIFNIKRQKKQLVKVIQFSERSGNPLSPDDILERRLDERYKRVGIATFGRFARYV